MQLSLIKYPYGGGSGSGGTAVPGGINESIQYNQSGSFGGSNLLLWNYTTNFLTLLGNASISENLGIGTNTPNSILDVTSDNLGTSLPNNSKGIVLSNNTVSTSTSTNQNSPILRFRGNSWNTADSNNRTFDYVLYGMGISSGDSGQVNSSFNLGISDNQGTYSPIFQIEYDQFENNEMNFYGVINVIGDGVIASSYEFTSTDYVLQWDSASSIILTNGNSPTSFRLYNIYNEIVDTEYVEFSFVQVANIFTISNGATGTGVARPIAFLTPFSVMQSVAPTAYIHLGAGTAAAGTSPLKLTAGTLLTVPENGAFEMDNTHLYWTDGAGTRHTIV